LELGMQLCTVVHDVHFDQPAKIHRVYPSKMTKRQQ